MNLRTWTLMLLGIFVGAALTGCGGSDGSSSTGRLSLSVTDAPVDEAAGLYLTLERVTLQGIDGSPDAGPFPIPEDHALVNLMDYTGTESAVVLSGVEVPAGTYKVRFDVDLSFAADAQSSWIAFAKDEPQCQDLPPDDAVWSDDQETCRYRLTIPSGEQSGFKPKGDVTIEAGGTSHFTVEFDLRKNVVDPESQQSPAYVLKPTGLRLVNNAMVGTISGTIDGAFPAECTPGVYLYDSTPEYVTSVGVDGSGSETDPYHYLIGFVPAGDGYSVELTCDPASDPLVSVGDAAVTPGEDTPVHFSIP